MSVFNPAQISFINPAVSAMFFEDFTYAQINATNTVLQAENSWLASITAASSITQEANLVAGQAGVLRLTAGGVGAGDKAGIGQFGGATSNPYRSVLKTCTIDFSLAHGQAALANFEVRAGLSDSGLAAGEFNSGIYFRQIGLVNWGCVTRKAGVETVTASVLVPTTTPKQFKIIIDNAGTTIAFLINNVVVATHTTNIPAAAVALGQTFKIDCTALIASSFIDIDYTQFVQQNLTR